MAEIKYRFKKYVPKNKNYDVPSITILKTGSMRLNQYCRKFLNKKPYCELLYDEKEKVVAIKPIQIELITTLRITNWKREDNSLSIQCKNFFSEFKILEYLGLDSPLSKIKSIQIPAQWNDKNKMFFVNLKYFKEQINAEQA